MDDHDDVRARAGATNQEVEWCAYHTSIFCLVRNPNSSIANTAIDTPAGRPGRTPFRAKGQEAIAMGAPVTSHS